MFLGELCGSYNLSPLMRLHESRGYLLKQAGGAFGCWFLLSALRVRAGISLFPNFLCTTINKLAFECVLFISIKMFLRRTFSDSFSWDETFSLPDLTTTLIGGRLSPAVFTVAQRGCRTSQIPAKVFSSFKRPEH